VVRETGVTFAYAPHHGDPYVFPAGVAEQKCFQDPVVRQPDPTEVVVALEQEQAAGATSCP
jgi:hypothetical protein